MFTNVSSLCFRDSLTHKYYVQSLKTNMAISGDVNSRFVQRNETNILRKWHKYFCNKSSFQEELYVKLYICIYFYIFIVVQFFKIIIV